MESHLSALPPNPKDEANFISVIFFWWTIAIFKRGYKKVMDVGDIFQTLKADNSTLLGDRLEKNWYKQLQQKNPSLVKALFLTFKKQILVLSLLVTINEFVLRLSQPFILGKLLMYFRTRDEKDNAEALYYGGGLIGLIALQVITINHFTMNAFHMGMKFRIAVCSLIYRKSLRLSSTALGDTSPGKIINYLSNDVGRFDIVAIFINSMWSAPLISIIVGILLWQECGWPGIVGIIVVLLVVPIQSYTGSLSSKFRFQTAVRTDERCRFMEEIVYGVQVIKLYAWEKPFAKIIAYARVSELQIVRKNSHVRALYMTFSLFTTRAAMCCTMVALALTGGEITAARIFVIASYFSIISWTMSQMFVRGVAEVAEVLVAVKRITGYLLLEEKPVKTFITDKIHKDKDSKSVEKNGQNTTNIDTVDLAIDRPVILKNVKATWKLTNEISKSKENVNIPDGFTLSNINLELKKGHLIGVCGSVGSGKSSLLQILLQELPILEGSIVVNGRLSYTAQEPWVFGATVKQNILFGEHMNRRRYDDIVKTCALIKDFQQFPDGDETLIGEKGASLSGGQKARISLARSVYREADIYLFDDPLSAVDAQVGKQLFNQVLGPKGKLFRKTRILVTHQIHFLKAADWVIILDDGKIKIQGSPHDLASSGVDFAELLMSESEKTDSDKPDSSDPQSPNKTYQKSVSRASARSLSASFNSLTSIDSIQPDVEFEEEPTKDIQNLEASSKGVVKGSLIGNYFKSGTNVFVIGIVFLLFIITQFAASIADYWVSYWTSLEEQKAFIKKEKFLNETSVNITNETDIFDMIDLEVDQRNNLTNIVQDSYLSTDTCMIIHGTLVIIIFTIGIVRAESFYSVCIKASQRLHDGMFKGIISAGMNFFDNNTSGRVLNRFSKDMGQVDEMLPKVMLDTFQILLMMFGAIVVTASVKPIFLIVVGILGSFFLIIRRIYLKTSKNAKRLEGMTRSPVFNHLSATLYGLPTIRAFGAQEELIKEFDDHQNIHSSVWYIFISTSTAFGLFMDITCLIFLACVTFYFLLFDSDVKGNEVGLAITQCMTLAGLLQWGIRQSAEVSNQLMSVERILEYCQIDSEDKPKTIKLHKEWPMKGKIEFKNMCYRYTESSEPVLKNLSFVIQPKEKIGIVGRTGAGKSSLIGALFRLAFIKGEIVIDDIDTNDVPLTDLRTRISIIPQDPVLFSGTLRRNLDPFEEYPDAKLWEALEAVELKDVATDSLGLYTPVMAKGGNFSVGQRQLVCLARAILRKNKILVLDEATANVDPHTDSLIQTTIRKQFCDCTVLTIAHRLYTIMDSDRILVMNMGEVMEFDLAYNLLQNPDSLLKTMVKATGSQESAKLYESAKVKYESVQHIL